MGKAKAKQKRQNYVAGPGYDGAEIIELDVRVSTARKTSRSMRARPGTFEWRYGRETGDGALYHAGVHYADLWEKAGTAHARTVDWAYEGHTDWKGLPDGRVMALDEVNKAVDKIGMLTSRRLCLYCVEGKSVSEIARMFEVPTRDMAAVLKEDLRAVALHFRYL